MAAIKAEKHEMVKGVERAAVHVGAVAIGTLMMIVGLAMGVSLVMLPVGIVVGLAGLLAFMWGLCGNAC